MIVSGMSLRCIPDLTFNIIKNQSSSLSEESSYSIKLYNTVTLPIEPNSIENPYEIKIIPMRKYIFLILLTEQLLIYRLYLYFYFLAQDFIQPFGLLYEVAGIDSYVDVRVDIYPLESNNIKTIFFRAAIPEWKQTLLNCFTFADLKIVTYTDQDSCIETDIKIDSNDRDALIIQEISSFPDETPRNINIKNFMFFRLMLKKHPLLDCTNRSRLI